VATVNLPPPRTIRQLLRPPARALLGQLLRLLPDSVSGALIRRHTRLANCYPPGRDLLFDGYLGDLKVKVNTYYPIEHEMLAGRYDPITLDVIRRFVHRGHVCLDAGANVGAFTLALAKQAAPSGRVFAFEPGPFLVERLRRNLALNSPLERITTVVPMGLADIEGQLPWAENKAQPGNAGFMLDTVDEVIPVTTVDAFFGQHPLERLDFVKIDVEGMEYEVLKGGLQTWQRFRPILYFETLPPFEQFRRLPLFTWIEKLLADIGYSLYKPCPDGSVLKTTYPDLLANTLAMPIE
jgi:FkbM family methyltransferase